MKEFLVLAGYVGECCQKAHTTPVRCRARSDKDAVKKVRRVMERIGRDVGDCYTFTPTDADSLEALEEVAAEMDLHNEQNGGERGS